MIMEVDFVTSDMFQQETVEIDEKNDITIFEGERCGICMDIIFDRGVLDCCQHWFCFSCIDNWSTITNLCPLCQNEFQLITCVPVYDTIGNNKVDDDSFSRDDEWCIEGKNNTLSFPSYYIDENAVTCLDGDGCKIRIGSANLEEDSNLDTSIACDSCDIWYHAFCVGFDAEGTSEDTWFCPRCVTGKAPQKSNVTSIERPSNLCGPESCHTNFLPEASFSGKLAVSVADAGETALVVSMVDVNKRTEEASEKCHSALEFKDLKIEEAGGDNPKEKVPSVVKTESQPVLEGQRLELSLSRDTTFNPLSTSLVLSELNSSCADADVIPTNSSDVKNCLRKFLNDSNAGNKLSESETSIGLHLGLFVSSFISADHIKNIETEDQGTRDIQQQSPAEEPLLRDEKILHDANEEAVQLIGSKRKHADCRTAADKEDDAKNECAASEKKMRTKSKIQMESKEQFNEFLPDDSNGCPAQITVSKDVRLNKSPEKEDASVDIMSIVKGVRHRPSKGLANQSPADKSLKERENTAGLRVKKIMRRAIEDKESSSVVQKLRAEIREAVREKASADIGENLFDPKLLDAFRTAVAGPTTEAVEKLTPSALKAKKTLLQKGKIRENLTKKIYGNSNGRRKRAWDRECEVEFWKHRCSRATKPEKIATLKSVLNLLRKNPEGSEIEQASECQVANPILSRLYLADTSVFPRKDDIKPLSALTAANNPEENGGQLISIEKGQNSSLNDRTQKTIEVNKVSSKLSVPSVLDKGSKDKVPISKGKAAYSKAHPEKAPNKVNSQKETGTQSDDKKVDKRKWALEVLARKKAMTATSSMQEKQEDNAMLKGYPLLAQLPIDMRPVLAPSRHNKIPVSVRQTQLYRLTEHFLKKANLLEICRTAETELAVADAINIEKEAADKSNSKLVYLNLCSQEILRRSDNNESIGAKESNPSPILSQPVDQAEQDSELPIDSAVRDALKNAGLLSDSPPSSPCHNEEPSNEVGNSAIQGNEEGPDNIFEIDSQPEEDIYGDFEYDIEDEDYIGAAAMKAPKPPLEEAESKLKVVFSTLKHERMNNSQNSEDSKRLEDIEESKHSPHEQKDHIDAGIISSTPEGGSDKSCIPPEVFLSEEGMEPSLAECEELYGPDKEPLMHKFPEDKSKELDGVIDAEALVEKRALNQVKHAIVASVGQNSCDGENSSNHSGTSDNISKKDKSKIDSNRQCDAMNSVSKKVETYIKEHIRPLCKSGIITAEQYRWAVTKATDKVMKYHLNAKNANFLIKEGEKVKKLAEQYVEAAQKKEKSDMP